MIYTFEDFELDGELYELRRQGRRIPVEPQVFDVIFHLVEHRDRVVSKEELFESIWKTRFVTESALTSRIKAARRALEDAGHEQRLIQTVHGRGYRFRGDVKRRADVLPADEALRRQGDNASLVGRQSELILLSRLLDDTLNGARRSVLVTGESGIGKTALLKAFLSEATAGQDIIVAGGQCLEHQGPTEPYMPLFEALDNVCRAHPSLSLLNVLVRYAPSWVAEMPWLLDDEALAALTARTVGNTRLRMLRELVEATNALADVRPVVLVLEDLQWSDPSTLDALNALVRTRTAAPVLVLATLRTSAGEDNGRSAAAILHELVVHGLCEEIALSPLDVAQVDEYLSTRMAAAPLPDGTGAVIHSRTGGNPLFVEVLLRELIPQQPGPGDAVDIRDLATKVPDSLRRMVELRLAGLDPRTRQIVEAAAVAGVDTAPALVARSIGGHEEEVELICDRLARSGQFLRRKLDDPRPDGAAFGFAHSLYQDVIYDQVPPSRRARLHGEVGRALEASYGSRASDRAGELAFHFGQARDPERAVRYLQIAAGQALRRYAYQEAAAQLTSALTLLGGMEPAARGELEIGLRDMLALTRIMINGWSDSEAEPLLQKALDLATRREDPGQQSLLLYHLAAVYENRGEHHKSSQVLQRRLQLHPRFTDSTSLLESHELLACALFHKGGFTSSLQHADEGARLYDPDLHLALIAATIGENLGVSCHTWAALDLWYLGEPNAAKERIAKALDLAREPSHQYCLARTEERAAIVYQLLGEPLATRELAGSAIDRGTRQGHEVCVAAAHIVNGWARASLGEVGAGLAELRSGISNYEALGSRIGLPYFLALLADSCLHAGLTADALNATHRGLGLIAERGFSHEAELLRLRGQALNSLGRRDEGLGCLRRAVDTARRQGARSLELRAVETLRELAGAPR